MQKNQIKKITSIFKLNFKFIKFRDVFFYILSLFMLLVFFVDEKVNKKFFLIIKVNFSSYSKTYILKLFFQSPIFYLKKKVYYNVFSKSLKSKIF